MGKNVYAVAGSFAMRPTAERGIRIFRYDEASGDLTFVSKAFPEWNAGAQGYDSERNVLFITDESQMHGGAAGSGGRVMSCTLSSDGIPAELNERASLGLMPSFICYDPKRQQVIVPHHGMAAAVPKLHRKEDGSYEVIPEREDTTLVLIEQNEDGSLGKAVDAWIPEGVAPHMHNCILSPSGDHAFVCDKGLDQIHVLKISKGKMEPVYDAQVEKGSHPRYSCFNPAIPVFYQNNEDRAFINVWNWDEDAEKLSRIQSIALLEDEEQAAAWTKEGASDLLISADGKYLYATLRGLNVLAVYRILEDGTLEFMQNISCGGANPRGLGLAPDGRFLFVMNRDSDQIAKFLIGQDGTISDTGVRTECPIAANIAFITVE